jgi:hypothetical protein
MAWAISIVDIVDGILLLWWRWTIVTGRLLRRGWSAAIIRWAGLIPVLVHHLRRLRWLLWLLLGRGWRSSRRVVS